jgi:hypothetical protein
MKLVMTVLFALGMAWVSAQAPTEVRTTFEKIHPGTKVEWKLEGGYWHAYYTDTKTTTVRTEGYDEKGNKIYDRTEVSSTDIPVGIRTYYTKNYPKVTTYRVYSEDYSGGIIKYSTDYEGRRYYFNDKGEYIDSRPLNP